MSRTERVVENLLFFRILLLTTRYELVVSQERGIYDL